MDRVKAFFSSSDTRPNEIESENLIAKDLEAQRQSSQQSSNGSWLPQWFSSSVSSSSSSSSTSSNSSADLVELDCGCQSLSYKQRIVGFLLTLAAGVCMLILVFLNISALFLGSTQKFAAAYTLANVFLLGSVCFLVGPWAQLKNMFTHHRLSASLIYILSLFGTLYCIVQLASLFITVPMLAIQFGALLWYVSSYLPFGQSFLSSMCGFWARMSWGMMSKFVS
eukprot:TRINITY_DN754_c0_g1_i1.p1 TRINITY_DN754_c0_g1~~TRINITY_DN754_c0_g1_i1.p1  ORF type:complete len:224 (-),score=43.54 TRINITY_DN754_c0_g1_i1:52-723(-)